MAKFRFKLESILRIKEKIEEQKKLELGNAMIFLDQQLLALSILYEDLNVLLEKFEQMALKRSYPKDYIQIGKSIQYVEDSIVSQKENISQAEIQVELKRKGLNAAVLERKTYEKLKEIAYDQYLQEETRGEHKQLDELTSYNYRQ